MERKLNELDWAMWNKSDFQPKSIHKTHGLTHDPKTHTISSTIDSCSIFEWTNQARPRKKAPFMIRFRLYLWSEWGQVDRAS